jgi:predicted DNA-binding transcriptional regulator YafY
MISTAQALSRKEAMPTPASRLITLITLLQNRPNQKAAGLANTLGVSVRTLHRYFGMLDEMGIPVYAERGPYGGFSLVRGYKLPPLVFTPEEATALSLGTGLVEEMWGALYREAAHAALAKLENLLPEAQRDEVTWARHALVTTGLYHPSLDTQAAALETLRRSIRESHRVTMIYQSAAATEPGKRKLDPYALALRWGWWYVVGYCHTRKGVRTFRIDRIQEVSLADEMFELPADFDAREFLARDPEGQLQIRTRLRFAREAAHIARTNRAYWDELEEQADGSVVVTATAPDLQWAASNTLAYGPAVEVLEPPELRQLIQECAQAIANLYGKNESKG